MNYFLRILPEAEKQLLRLNSPFYESVKRKISSLGDNPRPPGCRKLKGVKVGDFVQETIGSCTKSMTAAEL